MAVITRTARKPPVPFPVFPNNLDPDLERFFQTLRTYLEKMEESLRLPPHTAKVNQFLRHDATGEKLTWQELGTPILVGRAGVPANSSTSIFIGQTVVHTTLVTNDTIILLSSGNVGADTVDLAVIARTPGRNFTINAFGLTANLLVDYALFERTAASGAGSDGTCPLVKTAIINGSSAVPNGTVITLTWNVTMSRWVLGATAWQLFDNGTQYFLDSPGGDQFALTDTASCPPNGVYPQVGGGAPGATATIS